MNAHHRPAAVAGSAAGPDREGRLVTALPCQDAGRPADLQRLLAEEWPDGTFGGPRQTRNHIDPPPDPNAAAHCRELLAALAERPAARGDPLTGGAGLVGP